MSLKKSTSGKISRNANRDIFEQSNERSSPRDEHESKTEFATALRSFIHDEFAKGREITDQTPLLSGGLVDSLGLVNVLLFVEETLKRQAPLPTVIGFHHYDTIERIIYLFGPHSEVADFTGIPTPKPAREEKLQRYKNSQRDFDFILFSSSTMMLTPTRRLAAIGHNAFNFSLSGGRVIDFYTLLRFVEENGSRMPRRILMGCDPDTILRKSLSPLFKDPNPDLEPFLEEIRISVKRDPVESNDGGSDRSSRLAARLRQLQDSEWSPKQYDFELVANGDQIRTDRMATNQLSISDDAIRSDLSGKKIHIDQILDFVPPRNGRAMMGLAEIARRHDIYVDIVLPPVHPLYRAEISNDPKYRRGIDLTHGLIEYAKFENLTVHDFCDIRSFGGVTGDFDDSTHPGPENCFRVLRKLFPGLDR